MNQDPANRQQTETWARESLSPGLYLHLPFCFSRCSYCDFHIGLFSEDKSSSYLDALEGELDRLHADNFVPKTVFVGGGTPSALEAREWKRLLQMVSERFSGDRLLEWTVEANPDSLDPAKIEIALECGVDRISTGAQTFSASGLEILGRRHDAERVRQVHRWLAEFGMPRTSLDLIIGWPGQKVEDVLTDIDAIVEIDPDHISLYHLSYEKGTVLDRMRREGQLKALEDEAFITLARHALGALQGAGYTRYEVSNLYTRGGPSLHNLNYWLRGDYVGVGSGASSFDGLKRWRNKPDISAYIAQAGSPYLVDEEVLSKEQVIEEHLLLSLRLSEGLSLSEFQKETGISLEKQAAGAVAGFIDLGWLDRCGDRLLASERGFEVLDEIIVGILEGMEADGVTKDGCTGSDHPGQAPEAEILDQ